MLVSYDDNSGDEEATVETTPSIQKTTTPTNNVSNQTINQTKRVITLTLPLPKYEDHDDNDNRPLSMNVPIAKNATLTSILPPPKKSNLSSTSNTSNPTITNIKSQLSNDTTTKTKQTSRIILPKQTQPQTTATTHPQNPKVRIVQSNTTSNGRILPPQLRKFIESTGVKTSASESSNLVNSSIQYPVNTNTTQSVQPQHPTIEKNQPILQEDNEGEEEEEGSFFTFETPDYSKFATPSTIQYPNTQNTLDETSEENADQTQKQQHEIQKHPVEIQPDFGPALPPQEPLYSYNDYHPSNSPHPYLPTQYNEYTATIPQWEQSKTFKTRGVTDFIEVTQQDQLRDAHSFQKMSVGEQAAQQSALSVLASGVKPTTQQKRKHQLTYLAFEAKQKELLLAERKASSKKTKAETRAKYIW